MAVGLNTVIRIVATFDIAGATKAQNVYHVRMAMAGQPLETDVVDAAVEYVEAIMANFTNTIDQDVSLEKVECYERGPAGWEPIGVGTGTWAGTANAARMPSGASMLVRAFKDRTGHSDKKFFAGFVQAQSDGDQWVSGMDTLGNAAGADWVAPFDNGTIQFDPVSYDFPTNTSVLYNGNVSTSNVISYQRRRKPGVGLT